jgi:hypothetical protein
MSRDSDVSGIMSLESKQSISFRRADDCGSEFMRMERERMTGNIHPAIREMQTRQKSKTGFFAKKHGSDDLLITLHLLLPLRQASLSAVR